MDSAQHFSAQLKHMSAALADIEKTNRELKFVQSHAQALEATLSRREALLSDIAGANRSLEQLCAEKDVDILNLTNRNSDLKHVYEAYREQQERTAEVESCLVAANSRNLSLEAANAALSRENEVLRAISEERVSEAYALRSELHHTRSALVDVAARRHLVASSPNRVWSRSIYDPVSLRGPGGAGLADYLETLPPSFTQRRSVTVSTTPERVVAPSRRFLQSRGDIGGTTTEAGSAAATRRTSTGAGPDRANAATNTQSQSAAASVQASADRDASTVTASSAAPDVADKSASIGHGTSDQWSEVLQDIERLSSSQRADARSRRWA